MSKETDKIQKEIKELRKIVENLAVTRWGQAGPDCMAVPERVRWMG